jgi:hypothetical protein
MSDTPRKKDGWDKADIIGKWLIGLAVAALALFANQRLSQKQENVKMVEMALTILRSEPDTKQAPLREWAIAVIEKTSPVPFSDELKGSLRGSKLPNYRVDEAGNIRTTQSGERRITE